jgi:LL-diaminopimelate aminotransferase
MVKGNPHFKDLKREYIFPIIEKKLAELKSSVPAAQVLNLGVGDIAFPLSPTIATAICHAVQEMTQSASIKGYGPSEGYPFLREAIAEHEYRHLGIKAEEIFISDGINTDITQILDLFHSSKIAIPDPAYPAYYDSNVIAGHKKKIVLLPCVEDTGFIPALPAEKCDLIYLCSPHNPTGVAMNRQQLKDFVAYARENRALILYDNAYEAFVTSPDVPRSIYEIDGAKEVALEFKSFSKSAGFTGLRCSYAVMPKQAKATFGKKEEPIHPLWMKRQSIKFNGVSYPIQKGAEAYYSAEGQKETREQIKTYLQQAKALRDGLQNIGHRCFGGLDSPYIWWKTPSGISSWEFFDVLLNRGHLIAIPGSGFGKHGEGYIRLSAFITPSTAQEALTRIKQL